MKKQYLPVLVFLLCNQWFDGYKNITKIFWLINSMEHGPRKANSRSIGQEVLRPSRKLTG
jgi:hypothetical protein